MTQEYQGYCLKLARAAVKLLKQRKQIFVSTFEIQLAAGGAGKKDDQTSVKESRLAEWGRGLKRDSAVLGIREQSRSISTLDCRGGKSRASKWMLREEI